MTDRAPRTATGAQAATARAGASGTRRTGSRAGHPLLRPFPLAVMTLATFLVVFTLLMARLTAGVDPALRASANSAGVSRPVGSGAGTVTTRASGAGTTVNAVAQGASAEGSAGTATPVATRTSGAAGLSGAGDD